jgi:hypothetical protein
LVNPVTTKGLEVPVAVFVPQVAVKPVAVVPVEAAVKATVICAAPAVTEVIVGLVGTAVVPSTGMTLTADEAVLVPALLVAVTVQEYVLPLVKPVTTSGLAVPDLVTGVAVPKAQDAV